MDEDFALTQETERGLADRDAHLCVAHLNMQLWNEWSGVVASLEENASIYVTESLHRKQAHDTAQLTRAGMLIQNYVKRLAGYQLLMAADSFNCPTSRRFCAW